MELLSEPSNTSDEEQEDMQENFVKPKSNMSAKSKENEDNIENTVFVGNLPKTINQKELKKLFRKFGKILNARLRCAVRKELKIPKKLAVIKKDFHEDSKHINAFIKFHNFEDCKAALKMNGELYGGHHLRVTLAGDERKSDPKKSIFVGNLPFKIQDDDLWSAFEDCGVIDCVRVIRDELTGIGKGFGYVNFKSADSVELALKLNGMPVLDRNIRVNRVLSDPKNNRNLKIRKVIKNKNKTELKNEPDHHESEKLPMKTKRKHDFQGQKNKRKTHKKMKKNNKFDKKKMVIKQIAEGFKR